MNTAMLYHEEISFTEVRSSTPLGERESSSIHSEEVFDFEDTLFSQPDLSPARPSPPPPPQNSFMESLRVRFPDGPPVISTGRLEDPDTGLGYTRRPTSCRISVSENRPSVEFIRSNEPQPLPKRSSIVRWCAKAAGMLNLQHDQYLEVTHPRPSSDQARGLTSPALSCSSFDSTPQTALFSSSLFDSSASATTRHTPLSFRDSAASSFVLGNVPARAKRPYPQPLILTPIQGSPNPASAPAEAFPPVPEKKRPSIFALNWLRQHQDAPVPVAQPDTSSSTMAVGASDTTNETVAVPPPMKEPKRVRIASPIRSPVVEQPSSPTTSTSSTSSNPLLLELNSIVKFSHPSKSLFILGFLLGPWCFLIGAFLLARNGGTFMIDRDGQTTHHSAVASLKRRRPPAQAKHKTNQSIDTNWDVRNRSRASISSSRLRPMILQSSSQLTMTAYQHQVQGPDLECIWVRRCRIASAASGALVLAGFIASIVVIITHLRL